MDLKGKTILTTRAASQSTELRNKLESRGARVIEYPTIEIVPVDDWSAIDAAIRRLADYQWLLFTSANAVDLFMNRLQEMRSACTIPIAVVGSATAKHLRDRNFEPAIIPAEFRAEGILAALPLDLKGVSILFPRAEKAREVLPLELRQRGARVDVITTYRTTRPEPQSQSVAEIVSTNKIDCIVFTSPSTIRYLAESAATALPELLKGIAVAVIGPVTREAAIECGLEVDFMPGQATIEDLVHEIGRTC